MMRSLWAGVTGLQAHQIAMDVEGNNIANVNTRGFKYSRANFSDLLSQTAKIATAPQGELGGKNSMQIGLGTQVSSVTKIFKQGSIETTDKNTDLAIQGDGFFVVSPDGGKTYKYTRNGDFSFDASGNFTESNGYIIQGWVRDAETGEIDATGPIRNITIPPGLTTPANDTSYITLKANLNSGDTVVNKKTIYALDAYSQWYDKNGDKSRGSTEVNRENSTAADMFNQDKELTDRGLDMGVLFNATGEAFNLQKDQGVWVSYARAETQFDFSGVSTAPAPSQLNITVNGEDIIATISGTSDETITNNIAIEINKKSSVTGVNASVQGTTLILTNDNSSTGTEVNSKNIKLERNQGATTSPDDFDGFLSDATVITAYQYTYDPNSDGTTTHLYDDTQIRAFKTTEDLRAAMQKDARYWTNYSGTKIDLDGSDDDPLTTFDDPDPTVATDAEQVAWTGTDINYTTGSVANYNPGVIVKVNDEGQFQIENVENNTAFDPEILSTTSTNISDDDFALYLGNSDVIITTESTIEAGVIITLPVGEGPLDFKDSAGNSLQIPLNPTGGPITSYTAPVGGIILGSNLTLPQGTTFSSGVGDIIPGIDGITVNKNDGTATDHALYLTIGSLTNSNGVNDVSANDKFTTALRALQGSLVKDGSVRNSQNIYAANHASSIDVYDSLGSKHTVRIEFTKTGYTTDGGTRWSMMVSVPLPGKINYSGSGLPEILTGEISFNSDGSLATFNPSSITYTANNGSTPNQNILLEFGTLGQFNGMTSFDAQSNTSGISQDGYPGGDLAGIRVDETGTLIGSFTNGRSFGLAQVAMAKFTNNEGLESDGGNTFIQTSNSGDPIIGQAAVGGRGFIQASSLEMSNVDLSRSLTQLIVIQRGYQANSKTITTSDQMLNTLLQLKQ